MDQLLNPNPVNNYLSDLPSLLRQARLFLEPKNREADRAEVFAAYDANLRLIAVNLGLLDPEEFDQLPFEKVFERLSWLLEQEETGQSAVPTPTIEERLAELKEAEEKVAKKEAQKELNQRLIKEKEKLAAAFKQSAAVQKALEEAQLVKDEKAIEWGDVVKKLEGNEEFSDFVEKTDQNPNYSREEKETILREGLKRTLSQTDLDLSSLAQIEGLPISLESFIFLAEKLQEPIVEKEELVKHFEEDLSSLSEEQSRRLQEIISPLMAANTALAKELGWEQVAKNVSLMVEEELKAEGFSLEQANTVGQQLAKEAERALPSQSVIAETSPLAPPIVVIKDQAVSFPTFPDQGRNLQANAWLEKDPRLESNPNQTQLLHWTITGISPSELERRGKVQQRTDQNPNSPRVRQIQGWATRLGEFQRQYFVLEAPQWQTTRTREIYRFLRQPLSSFGKISQNLKGWIAQTGVGQSLKSSGKIAAQKSLHVLWSTAKSKAGEAATKGLAAILTQLGLAGISAGTLNAIILVAGEGLKRGWAIIKRGAGMLVSGFGLANVVFAGLTNGEVPEGDKSPALAVVGCFVGLLFLGFFGLTNKESAFSGLGKGSPLGPGGSHPEGIPPQCQPSRHFAEEIICSLTTAKEEPCNQSKVNYLTWPVVNRCFDAVDFSNHQEELVRSVFYDSVLNYRSLQCVGFTLAVQQAMGKSLHKTLPHGAACDYAYGSPPANYRYVQWTEPVQKGDLAIWDGSLCGANNGFTYGHIAVVIDVQEGIVVVAEAIGDNVGVHGDLMIHPQPNDGNPASPKVYLRYSP